jgi:hypothetical protein
MTPEGLYTSILESSQVVRTADKRAGFTAGDTGGREVALL